ncbi:hypothetical protein FB446DRAFT_846689 [Lentinula raphanica]|nr:hypothetical protein FB446DRAFT_846689 [Lentinula raphanica]
MLFRPISILVHLCFLSLVYAAPVSTGSTDVRDATLPAPNDSQIPGSGLTLVPGTTGLHLESRSQPVFKSVGTESSGQAKPRTQRHPPRHYHVWFLGASPPTRPSPDPVVPAIVKTAIEGALSLNVPDDTVEYLQDFPPDHIHIGRHFRTFNFRAEETETRVTYQMQGFVDNS